MLKGEKMHDNSTDTISRQDALDALRQCHKHHIVLSYSDLIEIEEAEARIRRAPSAQPEIVHCKDCKNSEHWYGNMRRCFLWSDSGVSVFNDGYCNYAMRRGRNNEPMR